MMKLTKEIFTQLNEAKKKADAHAMHVDLAIESLQNICEHEYESDSLAGQYEKPSCKICGFEFKGPRDKSKRPETIVVDDVDKLNTEPFVMTAKAAQNFKWYFQSLANFMNGKKK